MSSTNTGVRSDQSGQDQRLPLSSLTSWASGIFTAAGLSEADAALVADSLVDADARGIGSHGIARTKIYCERLDAAMIDADAQPTVAKSTPATAHVDGRNAMGHIAANFGLAQALERAADVGAGVAVVKNSNHCGTLAYFGRKAAEQGKICIMMSNTPPVMVYFGGRTRAVGTNPLCIAVPRTDGWPLVLDMATSTVARGKLLLAAQTGGTIPEGWAVDTAGRATTNVADAVEGAVVPFGGPKGSGLAMMIELLTGALAAGITGEDVGHLYGEWEKEQRVSHFILVLDPDAWVGGDAFRDHVAKFAVGISELPTAEGVDRVLLPGEIEEGAFNVAREQGVVIKPEIIEELTGLSTQYGVALPAELDA